MTDMEATMRHICAAIFDTAMVGISTASLPTLAGVTILAVAGATWSSEPAHGQQPPAIMDNLRPGQVISGGTDAAASTARACPNDLRSANVVDQGAVDCTGASDSAAGFEAAVRMATTGNVTVRVPAGNYLLASDVSSSGSQTWILNGTKFSGSGLITDAVDWSAFQNRIASGRIMRDISAGNAFADVTQMRIGLTGSTKSYEKAAGYDIAMTYDPSSYKKIATSAWIDNYTLDAVGRQMSGVIAPGNMRGRAWGGTSGATATKGSDGVIAAHEFDTNNQASADQAYVDQPTTKSGIGIVAMGTTNSTMAIEIAALAGVAWHDGLIIRQQSVLGNAIRILAANSLTSDVYHVLATGDVLENSLTDTTGYLKTPTGTQAQLIDTAGTVIWPTLKGATSGGYATFGAAGTDATINIAISPKRGNVQLGPGATVTWDGSIYGNSLVAQGSDNHVSVSGSSAGSPVMIGASGRDPNVSIVLAPKGPQGAVQVAAHLSGTGALPPVASEGAVKPGSTDTRGSLTLVSGTTSTTLQFASAYKSAPFCVAVSNLPTDAPAVQTVTTTKMTLALPENSRGIVLTWHCIE